MPETTQPKVFSIRESLQGALQDYMRSSGFSCTKTEELVRDLVSRLAAYREENVELFPEVFILSKPSALASLSPGTPHHRVGTVQYAGEGADALLKNAAGLAGAGWSIYVVKRDENTAEYGIFRSQRHSFSTTAEETMHDLGDEAPVLVIRNRGHLSVELVNTKGDACNMSLTSEPAAPAVFTEHISTLVDAAAAKVPDANFKPYLQTRLMAILQRSHGTLISVIDVPADGGVLPGMADGVWIVPHVDLAALHRAATETRTADALADLQASEALLAKMTDSDGIVVLGSDGTIRAFRVFLTPSNEEKAGIPYRGGGRRRTFALMQSRVQAKVLKAAFFRSQDGETQCEGD